MVDVNIWIPRRSLPPLQSESPFLHYLATNVTPFSPQGCVRCYNQTATPAAFHNASCTGGPRRCPPLRRLIAVFEVANRKGVWIPAIGSVEAVAADGTARGETYTGFRGSLEPSGPLSTHLHTTYKYGVL